MKYSLAGRPALLTGRGLGTAALAAALVLFALAITPQFFGIDRNVTAPFRTSGPPPPRSLVDDLSLQPSAGAAALPFSYTGYPERKAERLPPEELGKWREYASQRGCSLDDADYEQIFQQLDVYRAAGGITEDAVEAAHRALDSTTLYDLRGGRVVNAISWGENAQSVGYWREVLSELAPYLPDLKALFSSYDKPRSWVAPLPPEAEAEMRAGKLSDVGAWLLYGCASTSAGHGSMHARHAAFARTGVRARRGPLPVFSGATIPGCFSDLLVPRLWGSTPDEQDRPPKHSGCPMANQTLDSRKDVAFWRGSVTGAFVDGTIPAQLWTSWQRQRLVSLSQRHPTHVDAAFVAIQTCTPPQCAAMRAMYGTAPAVGTQKYFSHKYLTVVDGNSVANRLAASLCSGSVVLLAQLFCEWYAFRLVPDEHFVPVRLDYADLVSQVDQLRQDPGRAQQIVAAATQLVNTGLREEDARCYMLRLLTEYAALYRPRDGQQQQPQQQPG